MKYALLLWPHANVRYQAESARLAQAELIQLLGALSVQSAVGYSEALNALTFEMQEAGEDTLRMLASHSLMYQLFEDHDGLLRPVCGRNAAFLGHDLPGILKYKGKTNEQFTAMTMNMALRASAFSGDEFTHLRFADPMCSKGTSLFLALNRGWHADGTDITGGDIRELDQFFKRYLEYHRIKHTIEKRSYTVAGAKPVNATIVNFAADPDSFRRGDAVVLRTATADCGLLPRCFGKNRYHIMATDLPYGVQHSAGSESFEKLLKRALPAWRDSLMKGGAIALSYNTNTLKTAALRSLMSDSGFKVMSGGIYDSLSHWVEQAVTRDIAIGVKE